MFSGDLVCFPSIYLLYRLISVTNTKDKVSGGTFFCVYSLSRRFFEGWSDNSERSWAISAWFWQVSVLLAPKTLGLQIYSKENVVDVTVQTRPSWTPPIANDVTKYANVLVSVSSERCVSKCVKVAWAQKGKTMISLCVLAVVYSCSSDTCFARNSYLIHQCQWHAVETM